MDVGRDYSPGGGLWQSVDTGKHVKAIQEPFIRCQSLCALLPAKWPPLPSNPPALSGSQSLSPDPAFEFNSPGGRYYGCVSAGEYTAASPVCVVTRPLDDNPITFLIHHTSGMEQVS